MYSIAARLILILSLLLSLQASASMFMEPMQKGHCSDMNMTDMNMTDMNMTDMNMADMDMSPAPQSKQHLSKSSCASSCCMAFVASSVADVMPLVKPQADYLAAPLKSPLRITRINFRPPIHS